MEVGKASLGSETEKAVDTRSGKLASGTTAETTQDSIASTSESMSASSPVPPETTHSCPVPQTREELFTVKSEFGSGQPLTVHPLEPPAVGILGGPSDCTKSNGGSPVSRAPAVSRKMALTRGPVAETSCVPPPMGSSAYRDFIDSRPKSELQVTHRDLSPRCLSSPQGQQASLDRQIAPCEVLSEHLAVAQNEKLSVVLKIEVEINARSADCSSAGAPVSLAKETGKEGQQTAESLKRQIIHKESYGCLVSPATHLTVDARNPSSMCSATKPAEESVKLFSGASPERCQQPSTVAPPTAPHLNAKEPPSLGDVVHQWSQIGANVGSPRGFAEDVQQIDQAPNVSDTSSGEALTIDTTDTIASGVGLQTAASAETVLQSCASKVSIVEGSQVQGGRLRSGDNMRRIGEGGKTLRKDHVFSSLSAHRRLRQPDQSTVPDEALAAPAVLAELKVESGLITGQSLVASARSELPNCGGKAKASVFASVRTTEVSSSDEKPGPFIMSGSMVASENLVSLREDTLSVPGDAHAGSSTVSIPEGKTTSTEYSAPSSKDEYAERAEGLIMGYAHTDFSTISISEGKTTSTEYMAPSSKGGEVERVEGLMGHFSTRVPEERNSPEYMENVVLAALPCADAVAASPFAGCSGAIASEGESRCREDYLLPVSSSTETVTPVSLVGESKFAPEENFVSAGPRQMRDEGSVASITTSSNALTAAPAAVDSPAPHDKGTPQVAEGVLDSAALPPSPSIRQTQANGGNKTAVATRKRKSARVSDPHDDMMHIMCMICLEKLNDAAEGGGAKVLGLLDSCSHRYCYACILEWSNITNKCPQCKARFHTIKAVKELRRKNSRYRGMAVSVEDKDQKYSFVDVRDVVVLDPEVGCHAGCLLRGAVDALQEHGWEFSVQCEQCSLWFHGLCVGFRQEQAVPDNWCCRPCRGLSHQTIQNPDAIAVQTGQVVTGARSRTSSGRGPVRGRGESDLHSSEGQDRPLRPFPRQGRERETTSVSAQVFGQDNGDGGGRGHGRFGIDGQQINSPRTTTEADEVAATIVCSPQQAIPNLARQAPPSQPNSSSSSPQAPARRRGRPRGSRSSPRDPPTLVQTPLAVTAPTRGRGKPRGTRAPPPTSPPALLQPSAPPTSSQTLLAVAAPARGRGRPQGSRSPPALLQPPAQPTPSQTSQALITPAGGRGRPQGSRSPPVLLQLVPPTSSQTPSEMQASPALKGSGPRLSETPTKPLSLSPIQSLAPPGFNPMEQQQQQHLSLPFAGQLLTAGGEGANSDREPVETPESERPTTPDDTVSSGAGFHPTLPKAPAPSLLRSLEASQATDLCDICGFDTEPNNLIVYCESCSMGVHQTCYGISEIPTKEWYCSPCSSGVHPSILTCRFCPIKGGALKRCTDGSWGHILCAFWIPECCFLDPQKMEPIGSINKRGLAGGVEQFLPTFRFRKCHICGTNAGCAIRCHSSSCKFHLHPMCGSMAGSVYMEIETTMKTAADGTEQESVNLVAKCPKHNKTRVNRNRKGRAALASNSDPLQIIGKTLEITDPEREDALALEGKVTWFDPGRTTYCIRASSSAAVGGSGMLCGSTSSGGDLARGCAHWIAADKLVQAKAVRVDRRSGKKIAVEPLPSMEEGEGEDEKDEEKVQGQFKSLIKIEHLEGAEEVRADRIAGALPPQDKISDGGKEQEEEKNTEIKLEKSQDGDNGYVEMEVKIHEEDSRSTADNQSQEEGSTVSSKSLPDTSLAKQAVCLEVQTQLSTASLYLSAQPPRQEPNEEAEASEWLGSKENGAQSAAVQRGGGGVVFGKEDNIPSVKTLRNRPTVPPKQQQNTPLPSVQAPEQAEMISRYPIRGRRRRCVSPALDLSNSSTKRAYVDEEEKSVTVTAGGGSELMSGVSSACLVAATNHQLLSSSSYTFSEIKEQEPFDQNPQNEVSEMVTSKASGNEVIEPERERRADPAYTLKAGWPNGMELFGQVPAMKVRTFCATGCGNARYFAGAYIGTSTGIEYDERSAPIFSFQFEELEEKAVTHLHIGIQERDKASEPLERQPRRFSELIEARDREGKEAMHGAATKQEAEKDGSSRDLLIEREQVKGMENDRDRKRAKTAIGEQAKHLSRNAKNGGGASDMEDGQIQTLSSGRANTMPPGPGDEDVDSIVDTNSTEGSPGGVGEPARGANRLPNEVSIQTVGRQLGGVCDDSNSPKLEDTEKMIPRGNESCGRLEGSETASLCGSDEDTINTVGCDYFSCGETAADTSLSSNDNSALAMKFAADGSLSNNAKRLTTIATTGPDVPTMFSPGAVEIARVLRERLSRESSRAVQDLEPTTPAATEDMRPAGLESTKSKPVVTAVEHAFFPAPGGLSAGIPAGQIPREVLAQAPPLQRPEVTLALRTIVKEQLQDILKSASKGEEAALASGSGDRMFERIAVDAEKELFQRLYKDSTKGREYKAKYKQVLLSLGNVRNYRLVTSVLAGNTTPLELATKDAVGLLNSLKSSLHCLAVPLVGRRKQSSPGGERFQKGKGSRRGKMRLL